MSRTEHLAWCKKRALEYVDAGDLENAFASMASDMSKHKETKDHPALFMGMMFQMNGLLATEKQMRDFINGFN